MKLRLGGLTVPDDAVTQTFLVLGKRGSGKSNTAVVLAEEMHKAGAPFVVLDPIGAWWGLKSSFDGKGPGLPVYVFGGQHGDLPLQPDKGELMAQVFVNHRQPMVLDMKGWTGGERARFVTAFAQWLLGHNDRSPAHVFLEEADAFIPQRPFKGEEAMLGAMDRLVRWGRQEGLGSTTISQRSAKINKDVTTQTEVLIAHRTIGPQDRDVIKDWVRWHAGGEDLDAILGSIAALPDGTAWVWSPEWLGILKQVAFRRRETFDSASTPKLGEKRVSPKELAQVDLDRLRDQLADTIEKAKADDPKELRRRIAELERSLKNLHVPPETIEVEKVVEVVPEKVVSALQELSAAWADVGRRFAILEEARKLIEGKQTVEQAVTRVAQTRPAPRVVSPPPAKVTRPTNGEAPSVSKAERAFLSALAQFPDGRTKEQAAFLAGYAPSVSTTRNTLSALRTKGLISGWGVKGDLLKITSAGLDALGEWDPPLTGRDLIDFWYRKLNKAEEAFLRAVVSQHPITITKDEAAAAAGYDPAVSTTRNTLSKLRTLGLIEGYDRIGVAEGLLE